MAIIIRSLELINGNKVSFEGEDGSYSSITPFVYEDFRMVFHDWADRNMVLECRGECLIPYRPYRFDREIGNTSTIVFDNPEDALMAYLAFR